MSTETGINIRPLVADWAELATTLHTRKKLDFALFKPTFERTFAVLKPCRAEGTVDKAVMPLVVAAYKFVGTDNYSADFMPKSAFVLTERMLNYCVLSTGAAAEDENGVHIYDTVGYKEVELDFNDVDESINTLTHFFDKNYWTNLG